MTPNTHCRPSSGGCQSCVCLFFECTVSNKNGMTWIQMSLESSIMWVGTMLLILEFQFTVFISEIFQQPDCVCSRFLHVSQSVCAVVWYLIRSNLLYFLALFLVVLSRLLLLIPKQVFKLSGINAYGWQCSGHCILTLLISHNYVLWTQLHPCFWQTITANHRPPKRITEMCVCVCVHAYVCVCVCSAVI